MLIPWSQEPRSKFIIQFLFILFHKSKVQFLTLSFYVYRDFRISTSKQGNIIAQEDDGTLPFYRNRGAALNKANLASTDTVETFSFKIRSEFTNSMTHDSATITVSIACSPNYLISATSVTTT